MRNLFFVAIVFIVTTVGHAQITCSKFPVKVQGNTLVLNDGTGRRFFVAGMVDNRPSGGEQLSKYDHAVMEDQMIESKAIGCNAMRWNAFLKGEDILWDANKNVSGLKPGCLDALKDGLDLGYKYGIIIQIVLSTAHFQNYGSQGADGTFAGIVNKDRVANNAQMFNTTTGTQAYIDNVLIPICNKLGSHPALLGYVVINEAYGMTDPQDTPNGSWADQLLRIASLQRWANRIAGTIHRYQPGAICSVSGISKLQTQYEDAVLIAAGGDSLGVMDIHQYQYYPENHMDSYSPFQNTPAAMRTLWGGSSKPVIAGEFPIEGLVVGTKSNTNTVAMTPTQAYEALWVKGYSGGFTWSNLVYTNSEATRKASIDSGYMQFHENHLVSLNAWEKFDTTKLCIDCNGDANGTAALDKCNICAGGNTGIVPDASCQQTVVNLEAENGVLVGLVKETSYAGYSGTSYVGNFKTAGDKVTVTFTAPLTSVYEIWVTYHSPFAQKNLDFLINNTTVKTMTLPLTTTFTDVLVYETTLTMGTNTFSFLKNMGYLYIDKFIVKSKELTTSVENSKEKKLSFFPNPTQNFLYLSEDVQWFVYSMIGSNILTGTGNVIDMGNLQSGVYLIKLGNLFNKVIKN